MPSTEADKEQKPIHVVAAVIENARGHVLLSLRHQHVHQGGLWEFPGGKLEQDELPLDGLTRELHEEIGIVVDQARPLIRVRHDYGDRHVLLDVWKVNQYSGLPHGREGQALEWVPQDQLRNYSMPAADVPIVNAVLLPERLLITPEPESPDRFIQALEKSLQDDIHLVQLRAHSLDDAAYLDLARRVLVCCRSFNAGLILNRHPSLLEQVDADGVHLPSHCLQDLQQRPVAQEKWLSASCHNAEELALAQQLGVDFVLLSPVMATLSHPHAEPLGWPQFWSLSEQINLPVYALGGMSEEHLPQAFAHGAQGIAAIRSLWVE